jgi:hypothetical protein
MRNEDREGLNSMHAAQRLLAAGASIALVAAAAILTHCGGSGPTAPAPPSGEGELFFVDSGCACVSPPFTPIPIFVDGRQAGELPVFGKLTIPLAPGAHTWSDVSANDPSPNQVVIQPGQAVTENLFTNISCSSDQCSSDMDPMAAHTPRGGRTPSGGRPAAEPPTPR